MAQVSHTWPGPQLGHSPSLQAGAHSPVPKIQSAPGQSAWEVHGPPPVLVLVALVPVVLAAVVLLAAEPAPPVPDSTTAVPPHAAVRRARSSGADGAKRGRMSAAYHPLGGPMLSFTVLQRLERSSARSRVCGGGARLGFGALSGLLLLTLPACESESSAPVPAVAYDVERYDLVAEYDWERDRLRASLTLDATITGAGSVLVLDSAVAEVGGVRSGDGRALAFSAADRTLQVELSSLGALGVGASLSLQIDYEAAPGDGLSAVRARAGDPVTSRVLFTDSEPQEAREWMPCHDRPDDRALFSVELRMAGSEVLVANGGLTLDETTADGSRRMKYESGDPLPTYLMAFAAGELLAEQGQSGDLPIAIWHRPGVVGDYPGTLAELQRLLDVFQGLLGPYPFPSYAVVMLPAFNGGMENAGITFQSEVSTAEPALSMSLLAHELGHQWWGDAVTVATWDDVWIKEGMATLLQNEATRAFEDQGGTGTLFGDRFYVVSGEAVRDRALAPVEKYTSGPYDRAAWVLTQLRYVLGEAAFWGTLRSLADANHLGALSTETFVAAFSSQLEAATTARLRAAIDAPGLPQLTVVAEGPGQVTLTLSDPAGVLLAPLELAWQHEDGTRSRRTLAPNQPEKLARPGAGDFLVLDPDDVHPSFSSFVLDQASWDAYWGELAPLETPTSAAGMAAFAELPGVSQTTALLEGSPPPITAAELGPLALALDSESAKVTLLARACERAAEEQDPALRAEWTAVLDAELTGEVHERGLPFAARLTACSEVVDPLTLFAADWDALGTLAVSPTRAQYLYAFDLPFSEGLARWGAAASGAESLRVRALAGRYLRARGYATAEEADLPAWRTAVLALVNGTRASEVLRQVVGAGRSFASAPQAEQQAFVSALVDVLRAPETRPAHEAAVCVARDLLGADTPAWRAFVAAVGDAPLAATARARLTDPALCG